MFKRILRQNGQTSSPGSRELAIYQSTLLQQAGVLHSFSTRQAAADDLEWDLADVRDPVTGQITPGYQLLMHATGCLDYPLVHVTQVHGSSILLVDENDATVNPKAITKTKGVPLLPPASADGLVTATPGLALTIRIADCVPILLAALVDNQPMAVAAVHAGWRGLVAGIIPQALRTLHLQLEQHCQLQQKSLKTADIHILAAVGPCISANHYEVGQEVADAFTDASLDAAIVDAKGQKPHINLSLAAKLQLQAAGLAEADIDPGTLCTFDQQADFFSHRRDHGQTGRLAAMIAMPALPRH